MRGRFESISERLVHPPYGSPRRGRSSRSRLSTAGHAEALRAFARAARRTKTRFLVIGGTYRDLRIRPGSTRDIDVVLVDRETLDARALAEEGFLPVEGSKYAWRFVRGATEVEVQIAAIAKTRGGTGPFSAAAADAERVTVEGHRVLVPRIEDFVVLKLFAIEGEPRRVHRDLAEIQAALEAHPRLRRTRLSIPALRRRLRDRYGIEGRMLRDFVARLRLAHRLARPEPAGARARLRALRAKRP